VPELGSLGSVRGALSNARPYREHPNGYSRPHGFDKKTGTFGNYLNFRPLFSVGDAPQRDRQNSPIDNSRNAPQIRPDGTN
jgi:hypothetical protein